MKSRHGTVRFFCLGALFWAALGAPVVRGQSQVDSVGVLYGTGAGVPDELAKSVDAALLRDLAGLAHIHHPIVSPANYEAVQLAVGCEGESRECLSSIAETLHTDSIVVRRIDADPSGLTTLELFYYAGNASDVARAQTTVPAGSQSDIVAAVPKLVRQLFRLEPEPAPVPAAPLVHEPAAQPVASNEAYQHSSERESPERAPRRIGTWTWVALISGAALLGTGAGIGLTAKSSFDTLKKTEIDTPADARGAQREFDSIGTRATAANVLMPAGGAVLALGGVLLVLDLTRSPHATERATNDLSVVPVRGGAVITWLGKMQ